MLGNLAKWFPLLMALAVLPAAPTEMSCSEIKGYVTKYGLERVIRGAQTHRGIDRATMRKILGRCGIK